MRTQKIQSINKPTWKHQNAVHNFIANDNNIVLDELDWIKQRDDLASISREGEHGLLNAIVGRGVRLLWPAMLMVNDSTSPDNAAKSFANIVQSVFRTKTQKKKSRNTPSLHLVSPYRINVLVNIITVVCASGILLLPVYILFMLAPSGPSKVQRAGNLQIFVIFICTVVFSLLCSVFTIARSQQVFAATAVYCAVLIIFWAITSSS